MLLVTNGAKNEGRWSYMMKKSVDRGTAKTIRPESGLTDRAERAIREWEQRNRLSVLADKNSKNALAKLFRLKCDPLFLLESLRTYSLTKSARNPARKNMERFLKRANKLAKRLREDAKEVKAIDQKLRLDLDFPDGMLEFADYLLGAYRDQALDTILFPRGGVQVALVDVVNLVKMVTGRQHYSELAAILQPIGAQYADADDLRKVISNFENRLFGGRSERELKELAKISRLTCDALGAADNS
jgi:hypothetical protein